MVNDTEIKELKTKIERLLKHLVCRNIKLQSLEFLDQKTVKVDLSLPVKNPAEGSLLRLSLVLEYNKDDVKNFVWKVLQSIPKDFLELKVQNIKSALQDIHYNFSNKNLPNEFSIIKLPYRQLAVATDSGKFFVDLCTSSYQRILAILDENSAAVWKNSIEFSKIASCMRRKEIVTLLLTMSTLASNIC